MKKKSNDGSNGSDGLVVTPFTREQMRRGVMGKYYRHTVADSHRRRTITLASDVAKLFRTDAEVNEALRLVQRMREIGKTNTRRKTA
jgi:hypothetical protein